MTDTTTTDALERDTAAALEPQGWTRTADGLTAPSGSLIATVRTGQDRTPRGWASIKAVGPGAVRWQIQGTRLPVELVERVLHAAASAPARGGRATYDSVATAMKAAGWNSRKGYETNVRNRYQTTWTRPDGKHELSAVETERPGEWHVRRDLNSFTVGTWTASGNTPHTALCALALADPRQESGSLFASGTLAALDGLHLAPSAKTPDRLYVRVYISGEVKTIGSIQPTDGGWTARLNLSRNSGVEEIDDVFPTLQTAMAAVSENRRR